jgi:hypothetical protein
MSASKMVQRSPPLEPPCEDGYGHSWQEEAERTAATTFERCARCGAKRITTVRYARPESQWVLAKRGVA